MWCFFCVLAWFGAPVFTHVPCFVQIILLSTIQALCNVFASSECKGVIIVWNYNDPEIEYKIFKVIPISGTIVGNLDAFCMMVTECYKHVEISRAFIDQQRCVQR